MLYPRHDYRRVDGNPRGRCARRRVPDGRFRWYQSHRPRFGVVSPSHPHGGERPLVASVAGRVSSVHSRAGRRESPLLPEVKGWYSTGPLDAVHIVNALLLERNGFQPSGSGFLMVFGLRLGASVALRAGHRHAMNEMRHPGAPVSPTMSISTWWTGLVSGQDRSRLEIVVILCFLGASCGRPAGPSPVADLPAPVEGPNRVEVIMETGGLRGTAGPGQEVIRKSGDGVPIRVSSTWMHLD